MRTTEKSIEDEIKLRRSGRQPRRGQGQRVSARPRTDRNYNDVGNWENNDVDLNQSEMDAKERLKE